MELGIDISHWQNDKSTAQKMDFAKAVEQGAKYVFIKISERGEIDEDFEYNWQAAKDAGLLRGGYHFLRWDLSGLIQARIFCDIMMDDPGELPPVADFEAPRQGSKYPSNALLYQFLQEVEARDGRTPIIYTSPSYWDMNGRNKTTRKFEDKWAYYPLWVANYSKDYEEGVTMPRDVEPWASMEKEWTFWQFTPNGDGPAFGAESKSIDLNWFNGDLNDLYAFAGINKEVESEEPSLESSPPTALSTEVATTALTSSHSNSDISSLRAAINQAIDHWLGKK